PFIADALAMPVHWYYNRTALFEQYGEVRDYLTPRSPHPDSILWRSSYQSPGPMGNILGEQAVYWGKHGVHYHQFLNAGENTLNFRLAHLLAGRVISLGRYDFEDYLEHYVEFMLTPGAHRDTYVEEYHRSFFARFGSGFAARRCGGRDFHIGGLVPVGTLGALLDRRDFEVAALEHVGFSHCDPEVMESCRALIKMLCAILDGEPLREVILKFGTRWVGERKLSEWERQPDTVVVGRHLSPACYIVDAFTASLYLAWKYHTDFETAVIVNTNLGGDNCHRGAVVGALVGAAVGEQGIPARWIKSLRAEPPGLVNSAGQNPQPIEPLARSIE
ncbi:MAG: ADP-ribosylglycohydrolase family protein, partial [Verrucomicrobiia bacterium]